MTMDWPLATSILGIVTTVAIFIAKRIHSSDWENIRALKQDSDNKIESLAKQVNAVDAYLKEKLDKQEHQIALARIDKEMDVLRREQREDFSRIEKKLDRMMELIAAHGRVRRATDEQP